MPIELRFESTLSVSPSIAWRWVTDIKCLRAEMRPLLWMSIPKGIRNLEDVDVQPGQRLFTSWLWLFGCLPMGTSRLTLLSLTPGVGFVEESPMTGMCLWRHQRRIEAHGSGTRVIDHLSVDPLLPALLVKAFLRLFFASRHRALRQRDAGQSY